MTKRFTFWRNSIVSETYEVEAESEDEARAMLDTGQVEMSHSEWMDWSTRDFQLEQVEELDPLYCMVKEYKSVDKV